MHPISQVMDELDAIFADMGFTVAEGPAHRNDWHNFTALNIPPEHPARQDARHVLPAARDRRHAAHGAAHPHLAGADPHHAERRAGAPIRIIARPHLPHRQDATTRRCSTRSKAW
jgi:phenylalanyl-tRNA synthetase alpha chain